MLIGRLEIMEEAKIDYISKISKVQEVHENDKVDPEEKYKDVKSNDNLSNNEIILENSQFGYNSQSNFFFLRVEAGQSKSNYSEFPTDNVMKLKKTLMEKYNDARSI
jgi:hypothetical protein